MMKRKINKSPTAILTADKCKCGCGEKVKNGNKYINHHFFKTNNPMWEQKHKRRSSKIHKGKVLSKETKKKISLARIGKELSEEHKRKIGENPFRFTKKYREKQRIASTGRIHTEETKQKIRSKVKGKNNGQWRGGSSAFPYSLEFSNILKEQIRKRDNYKCKICPTKQKKRKLPIHHIDYIKQNNKKSNLITLCQACHNKSSGAIDRKEWIKKCKESLRKKAA